MTANVQLIPNPPALRDGIARCLTNLWHGDAYLLFAKRRGWKKNMEDPLYSQERGIGGEFDLRSCFFLNPSPSTLYPVPLSQQLDAGKYVVQVLFFQHHPVIIAVAQLLRRVALGGEIFFTAAAVDPVNQGDAAADDLDGRDAVAADAAARVEQAGQQRAVVVEVFAAPGARRSLLLQLDVFPFQARPGSVSRACFSTGAACGYLRHRFSISILRVSRRDRDSNSGRWVWPIRAMIFLRRAKR